MAQIGYRIVRKLRRHYISMGGKVLFGISWYCHSNWQQNLIVCQILTSSESEFFRTYMQFYIRMHKEVKIVREFVGLPSENLWQTTGLIWTLLSLLTAYYNVSSETEPWTKCWACRTANAPQLQRTVSMRVSRSKRTLKLCAKYFFSTTFMKLWAFSPAFGNAKLSFVVSER